RRRSTITSRCEGGQDGNGGSQPPTPSLPARGREPGRGCGTMVWQSQDELPPPRGEGRGGGMDGQEPCKKTPAQRDICRDGFLAPDLFTAAGRLALSPPAPDRQLLCRFRLPQGRTRRRDRRRHAF